MKGKIKNIILASVVALTIATPCSNVTVKAVTINDNSVPITETKKAKKWEGSLDKLKAQIAGLLNIDIGDIEKIIVSTKDDVKVILKDSNINIDIDLNLININVDKK